MKNKKYIFLSIGIAIFAVRGLSRFTPPRENAAVQQKPLTIMSWNVKHLGRQRGDEKAMAELMQIADLVTLQEVNKSESGQGALHRIAGQISSSTGDRVCEGLSEIPTGATERYAYLWRNSRIAYVKENGEVLEECPKSAITIRLGVKHAKEIVREPAVGHFQFKEQKKEFILASIHLVPSGKGPQNEVGPLFETFSDVPGPLIIAGDFNLVPEHPVFAEPVRSMKFQNASTKANRTTLKMKRAELNHPYDHFFYREIELRRNWVINLYEKFQDTKRPIDIYNDLSDHCPIVAEFQFR